MPATAQEGSKMTHFPPRKWNKGQLSTPSSTAHTHRTRHLSAVLKGQGPRPKPLSLGVASFPLR